MRWGRNSSRKGGGPGAAALEAAEGTSRATARCGTHRAGQQRPRGRSVLLGGLAAGRESRGR